jgi:hypothetical protein
MKGWTEEEIKNKNLMAPCGLYCGACGIYIATRDKNDKLQSPFGNIEPMSNPWSVKNVLDSVEL